jgi:hypothetical protein
MISTDEGMQMCRSDEQPQNAQSPRLRIVRPASTGKYRRFVQEWKQDVETILIEEGTQIDRSDEQWEKAHSPRLDSLEPGSNDTVDKF